MTSLEREEAVRLVRVALAGVTRAYPNQPQHVLTRDADLVPPRTLHPAFYGCYDWHSAVHSHWMLAHALRRWPEAEAAGDVRAVLDAHLTAENLRVEADYLRHPDRAAFERPYGWAWLLRLAAELATCCDTDVARWSENLRPLVEAVVDRFHQYLPGLPFAVRAGTHANTAFALGLTLDYAATVEDARLWEVAAEAALRLFAGDVDCPAGYEPSASDFLSPALVEADLMRRVLDRASFAAWLQRFLPGLSAGEPASLLSPPRYDADPTDPALVHLDGLSLSRAWCLRDVAAALPAYDGRRTVLQHAAERHAREGLRRVRTGHYAGEHWLPSFALYLHRHDPCPPEPPTDDPQSAPAERQGRNASRMARERTTREQVKTTDAAQPRGAYSQGILAGGFLYTAGLGPLDPATGQVVGETIEEQTAQVMRNLQAILAVRGLGWGDVVKATVHLQEPGRDFAAFNSVYESFLEEPYPVRTTVGSTLAGILVEIDVVAVAPQG